MFNTHAHLAQSLKSISCPVPVRTLLFIPDSDQDAGHKTGSSCYQTTRPHETMTAVVRQTHWVIRRGQQPQTDPGDKHWQALLYSDLNVDFFVRGHTLKIDPYIPVTPSLRPYENVAIVFVSITNKQTSKQLLPFFSLSTGILKSDINSVTWLD